MASEDVKSGESAVTKIVNLAEEAKLAREGVVKAKPNYAFGSICKSLVAGGVAGGVSVPFLISQNFLNIWRNVFVNLIFICYIKMID